MWFALINSIVILIFLTEILLLFVGLFAAKETVIEKSKSKPKLN